MQEVRNKAAHIWLTTNDNTDAQRFYEHLVMKLVAVHPGAVNEARKLKPGIPELGLNNVPIRDELEYHWELGG